MPQIDLIALEITNNSDLPIDVKILQGNLKTLQHEAKNLYEYIMRNAEYNLANAITIDYYLASEPLNALQKTAPVLEQNINGILNALNSLNIGVFYIEGQSIYTYTDQYIYGLLSFI